MRLPHLLVMSIVKSLRDREVAYSASERLGYRILCLSSNIFSRQVLSILAVFFNPARNSGRLLFNRPHILLSPSSDVTDICGMKETFTCVRKEESK